jgi:hypothetical protein
MTKRAFLGVRKLIFLILFSTVAIVGRTQPILPPDPYVQLCTWSFDDTSWYSDLGYPPVSFTNLNNPPSFDGNALQVDSTNAAWLQYNIVEADGTTNLTFNDFGGTIELWVLPDWNSGTGPGDWGRLIDVGAFSTSNPSSWWSLYFSPDGTGLYFSSETNGIFKNYLNCPISWDTNTWHFLALTYSRFRSELYIDGQLATNGPAMEYLPGAEVVTNGFFVGSDDTGLAQSRALIDDMATYNYALTAYEVTNDYTAGLLILNGGGLQIGGGGYGDGDPGMPGDGGGTNDGGGSSYYIVPDYGTNLWIAQVNVSSNLLTALVSNTFPDILYEIQGRTNLVFGDWISFGFFDGSELTNCVPISVPANQQGNLFLQIRSWQDSNDSGIPDWWWLEYFGQTTNVDADASAAGDGYSNSQKFEMGLNPTVYYNPNPVPGFFGCLDTTGTNVILVWSNAPGPVINYVVQRGVSNILTGDYDYTTFVVNSDATIFKDAGIVTSSNSLDDVYNVYAVYSGSSVTATDTWQVSLYSDYASYGPPNGPPLPGNVYANADATSTNVLLSWSPASNLATNYIVLRGVFDTNAQNYVYTQIGSFGTNITSLTDSGVLTNLNSWNDVYEVQAVYPGGYVSAPANSIVGDWTQISINPGANANAPAGPENFFSYTDSTGTNIYLTWSTVPGAVTNYLIYGGIFDGNTYLETYRLLGTLNASTTSFESVGAIDSSGNPVFDTFNVVAVFADGSLSQSPSSSAAPLPGILDAYLNSTGTNVVLAWTPVPQAAGYVIGRSSNSGYTYTMVAQVSSNTTAYTHVGGGNGGLSSVMYEVQATYPHGGLSAPASASVSTNPPAPTGLVAAVDVTGTNAVLTWTPTLGAVSNYIILRGVFNPNTGTYSYAQIGTVGASMTSFTDNGSITNANNDSNIYEVEAAFDDGSISQPDSDELLYNLPDGQPSDSAIAALLVRNQTGRWQVMFSSIPTNVPSVLLDWCGYDFWYDLGPGSFFPYNDYIFQEITIPITSLTNGIYVIPDWQSTSLYQGRSSELLGFVRTVKADGEIGNPIQIGFLNNDAPCFVDGRQHLKQNLLFQLRSATVSQPNAPLVENNVSGDIGNTSVIVYTDTNYVESSIFHQSVMYKGYNTDVVPYMKMDNLWPFTANYELHQSLYDPIYSGSPTFTWSNNLVTVPEPAVLGIGDPYWIPQLALTSGIDPATGLQVYSYNSTSLADLAAYISGGNLYLQSGAHNLYGLGFATAMVNLPGTNYAVTPPQYYPPVTIAPGGYTAISNANTFYSQTVDPSLQLTNYYFAPVTTPGTELAGEPVETQAYPLPSQLGFANTNRTGLLVASVGQPTVIGGWARFSIQNGSSSKYAYLGQYYLTNAFVVTNGVVTTNSTGVVSPYGDFFPTQPGTVALTTMPDYDNDPPGTGIVRVISLNVDANHDGTMNFTFGGSDFVSSGKPFRFWANDVDDAGDFGGDGIPAEYANNDGNICNFGTYFINGRRDLVNFFPVYLNIGSLFQSNALSAGINYSDTNYQFALSQADGVLRFCYTDLTPTNYMNYLRDTNESGALVPLDPSSYVALNFAPSLTTISNAGVLINPIFISNIATNNGGIILVEACTNTTQPLVLTIYHGTNQIAQTSLYLSISGVEQMFRSKNLLLQSDPRAVPDRLTDADVPNEPDTIDKNFVFLHGYNVNPYEARGAFADMYKRLYWSGSHAKFYGIMWNGYDTQSQILNGVTGNLETNVVHAFNTASALNTFLNSLSGTNIVAAHSLGNMVVLSTLNDYTNQAINSYFMIDAAVAMEALDGTTPLSTNLVHTDWASYGTNLWASYWHNLFPTNDGRSQLTWNNRLAAGLQNAAVYNFYSSGEEVLRAYPNISTPSLVGFGGEQILQSVFGTLPIASYLWNMQELLKGRSPLNDVLGSDHGGWKFNDAAYGTNSIINSSSFTHMSPAAAALLPAAELQTNAFWDVTDFIGQTPFNWTQDLNLYGSIGSGYAKLYRNRLLSDAIPALTLPVGANSVSKLTPFGQPNRNFDMQSVYENGWPAGRPQLQVGNPAAGEWHHSDFQQVAYTFTYKLFDQFVTIGNLK